MNWTIFFAVLILICLFARPAWWVFKTAMSILGCVTGLCKGISDVRKKKKLNKQMKWLNKYYFSKLLSSIEIKTSEVFTTFNNDFISIWENQHYWRQKQAYEELIKEIK